MTEQEPLKGGRAMPMLSEPNLEELLNADVVQLLMKRHNVQPAHIKDLFRDVRERRRKAG